MKRHPSRQELLTYAGALVDKRGTLCVRVGGHVASCPACSAEVTAMRTSLALMRMAPDLEPSPDFTSRVILAAQQERRVLQQRRASRPVLRIMAKTLSYAAAILLVCAVCFGAALKHGVQSTQAQLAARHAAEAGVSVEAMRKASFEVQTLAAAIGAPTKKPKSLSEVERRRAVSALNADFEAAKAALSRNPGCLRASRVADATLQHQAQTLKALFAERSL